MFKHILIPTDGSDVAAKAIGAGVRLAAEMGAKVTGFHAEQPRSLHLHVNGYAATATRSSWPRTATAAWTACSSAASPSRCSRIPRSRCWYFGRVRAPRA